MLLFLCTLTTQSAYNDRVISLNRRSGNNFFSGIWNRFIKAAPAQADAPIQAPAPPSDSIHWSTPGPVTPPPTGSSQTTTQTKIEPSWLYRHPGAALAVGGVTVGTAVITPILLCDAKYAKRRKHNNDWIKDAIEGKRWPPGHPGRKPPSKPECKTCTWPRDPSLRTPEQQAAFDLHKEWEEYRKLWDWRVSGCGYFYYED